MSSFFSIKKINDPVLDNNDWLFSAIKLDIKELQEFLLSLPKDIKIPLPTKIINHTHDNLFIINSHIYSSVNFSFQKKMLSFHKPLFLDLLKKELRKIYIEQNGTQNIKLFNLLMSLQEDSLLDFFNFEAEFHKNADDNKFYFTINQEEKEKASFDSYSISSLFNRKKNKFIENLMCKQNQSSDNCDQDKSYISYLQNNLSPRFKKIYLILFSALKANNNKDLSFNNFISPNSRNLSKGFYFDLFVTNFFTSSFIDVVNTFLSVNPWSIKTDFLKAKIVDDILSFIFDEDDNKLNSLLNTYILYTKNNAVYSI